jgi:sugar phosphate permease
MGYLHFLSAHPRFLSFGFGLNVFVALGQTFYVSMYNSEIRAALSLSHGELAALYGSATIVGSVCLLGTGRLLDRVDLRWFTAATTVLVAIGCWLFAAATTVAGFFIAVFAVRFAAQGLWGVCAQVTMARYFDDERGKAAAVANTGYALGYAIFPLIGAWLLLTVGWREAWFFSGWFVLLVVLPLTMFQLWGHGKRHLAYEEKLAGLGDGSSGPTVHQWTLSEVLKDVRFWLLQPAMLVVPSIIFSIQFHQLFLVESKGWDLTAFAGGYSLYSGMSLLATLVSGSLIDRVGSQRIINFFLWPLIPALLVLAFFEAQLSIPAIMALTGLTFGLSLVVFVTLWAELYGTKYMGAIRSFNIFLNVSIASGVMVLTGWLIDRGVSILTMCAGGIVFVLLALISTAFARRLSPPCNQ